MMKNLLFVIATAFVASVAHAGVIKQPAQIAEANVYYGHGAELMHKVLLNLSKGQQEVIITNLSTSVDEKSLQIACPEGVVLMSYRFQLQQPDVSAVALNPVIKKLQDSIKLLNRQIAHNQNEAQIQDEILNKTAKLLEEYTKGEHKNLQSADVIKLIDYYSQKIQSIRSNLYSLSNKRQDLQDEINQLNTRIYELSSRQNPVTAKQSGELVMQLLVEEPVNQQFSISYFTAYAGWVPSYDIRANSINNSLKLTYKATVNQTTGIDWKNVKLKLSTNNPNLGTRMPELNPWILQLYSPAVYDAMNAAAPVEEVVVSGYGKRKASDVTASKSTIEKYTITNQNILFTTFEVSLPYDIPSDGKPYSVAIKDEKIPATFRNIAIPRMDKDAFLVAELPDWENYSLLPGEASVILDNVFTGKSFIDPNVTSDTLNFSLGRDKRVSVDRKLVKEYSKSQFIGNNKVEKFTYEITVRNNKKEAIDIILKDQVPLSTIKEMTVEVDETGKSMYEAESGMLTWNIKLKPGEVVKHRFAYTVKYPKDQRPTNLR